MRYYFNVKREAKKKIKDLPNIERPRERLIRYGPGKLSERELLAILLGSGRKGVNAVELASGILKKFGGQNILKADFDALKSYPGLGPAKACEIIACFELGKRLIKDKKVKVYLNPEDVWRELKDIRDSKKEHFVVFYLDSRSQEIKKEIISIGSVNANLVHPREVFEPAVRNVASHIIIAHNHPSGGLDPSENDLEVTKKLVKAGRILGIEILDHIIVAKNDFLSFKEKKLI